MKIKPRSRLPGAAPSAPGQTTIFGGDKRATKRFVPHDTPGAFIERHDWLPVPFFVDNVLCRFFARCLLQAISSSGMTSPSSCATSTTSTVCGPSSRASTPTAMARAGRRRRDGAGVVCAHAFSGIATDWSAHVSALLRCAGGWAGWLWGIATALSLHCHCIVTRHSSACVSSFAVKRCAACMPVCTRGASGGRSGRLCVTEFRQGMAALGIELSVEQACALHAGWKGAASAPRVSSKRI